MNYKKKKTTTKNNNIRIMQHKWNKTYLIVFIRDKHVIVYITTVRVRVSSKAYIVERLIHAMNIYDRM